MTLETKTSNPELALEEFSSNSKSSKKTYVMTKHVTKKMSTSTSVSSTSSVSGNTNEELSSSLFNNDNSLLNITDNNSTNKLMNFDVSPPMDFDMGLNSMNMNLDMQNQLSSMMEKEISSTCQKMIGMSTKKVSKESSISASTSRDSLSSSSSSIHNKNSSKNKSSSNKKAIVPSENGTVNPSTPFVVKIPLGEDILPEDLEVSLSEEKNGLKMMTVTAAQEKTSQTETTKSKSSRRTIKKFSLPPNANTDKISSTFVSEGNVSILKIEAPVYPVIPPTPEGDIPIPIKFEEY